MLVVKSTIWPTAPPDIAEEVELYAREGGRHATVHFAPIGFGGWFARFVLRPTDKRLLLVQTGEAEQVSEDTWFHVPNPYVGQTLDVKSKPEIRKLPLVPALAYGYRRQGGYLPLDIAALGRSGVREFLELGNTWSGRGRFNSLTAALKVADENTAATKKKLRERARQNTRDMMRDRRRSVLKIPFIPVLIDLKRKD